MCSAHARPDLSREKKEEEKKREGKGGKSVCFSPERSISAWVTTYASPATFGTSGDIFLDHCTVHFYICFTINFDLVILTIIFGYGRHKN